MYIRRTKTKTADHGEDSYTYRIVESVRVGTQIKQRTLLNLGKDFAIDPAHWPLLAARKLNCIFWLNLNTHSDPI